MSFLAQFYYADGVAIAGGINPGDQQRSHSAALQAQAERRSPWRVSGSSAPPPRAMLRHGQSGDHARRRSGRPTRSSPRRGAARAGEDAPTQPSRAGHGKSQQSRDDRRVAIGPLRRRHSRRAGRSPRRATPTPRRCWASAYYEGVGVAAQLRHRAHAGSTRPSRRITPTRCSSSA